MKVLVAGCTGFLGNTFGAKAQENGHTVLGIGRLPTAPSQWLASYQSSSFSTEDLAKILADFKPDTALFAVGSSSVADSQEFPQADFEKTIIPWTRFLEAVRLSGLRPAIFYPSSAAVYGNAELLPIPESAARRPLSPYGFHKVLCEELAREYVACFGLDVTILRVFSLFGAKQKKLLVWEIFRQLSETKKARLKGTGQEIRDYLSATDACKVILALAQLRQGPSAHPLPPILNLASGKGTRVVELAKLIVELVLPSTRVSFEATISKTDPTAWIADVSALKNLLPSWTPAETETELRACIRQWQSSL